LLSISGQRTSRFISLADKIAFLNEDREDIHICMVTDGSNYRLIQFKDNVINPGKTEDWIYEGFGYSYKNKGVQFRIVSSLSDQVWMKLDTTKKSVQTILMTRI
jgi:hypothetical protein